ncbi:hypothetical protein AAFM48_14935 [Burkholderia pseudomallei]
MRSSCAKRPRERGHEWGRGAERIARPARAARFALHAAPWPRGGLNGNRSARGGRYGATA